jgi:hypothetical protein
MAPATHTIRDPAGPLQVLLPHHAEEEDPELTVMGRPRCGCGMTAVSGSAMTAAHISPETRSLSH